MSYAPCNTGIHVCGITYQDSSSGEFYTALNASVKTPGDAKKLFRHLYLKFYRPGTVRELVVDLFINGSTEKDFSIEGKDMKALDETIDAWKVRQKRLAMTKRKATRKKSTATKGKV